MCISRCHCVYGLSAPACSHLTLKEEQLSFVKALHEGKDVFVWLPTGFGNILSLLSNSSVRFSPYAWSIGFGKSSAVLVISPLVSLMVDQVQKLPSRDAKTFISSSCTGVVAMAQELLATDSSLQHNRLFFCASESLMKGKWREALENTRWFLFVINCTD